MNKVITTNRTKTYYITKETDKKLKRLAKKEKMSESALFRMFVDIAYKVSFNKDK